MSNGQSSGAVTNEEILEQFRQQWRQELEQPPRPVQISSNVGDTNGLNDSEAGSTQPSQPSSPQSRKAQLLSRPPPLTATPPPEAATASSSTAASGTIQASSSVAGQKSRNTVPKTESTAVELYSTAVQAEREGRLNDALRDYRSAFRKDERVDKAYHRLQLAQQEREKEKTGTNAEDDDEQINDLVFTYQRTLQLGPDYEREKQLNKGRMLTANYIDRLLKSFTENPYISEEEKFKQQQAKKSQSSSKEEEKPPSASAVEEPLVFIPRKQDKPCHFSRLPDEIIVHILSYVCALSPNARYPDVSSLERGAGLVCRKLRILTLESQSLWKDICEAVYRPPLILEPLKASIPEEGSIPNLEPNQKLACRAIARAKYFLDWRLMWIEQPRIRTDGVYISQITYIRRGGADASFYDPTHVVTYYRYLVFLPSGDVVSLLSHDIPKEVVPNLLSSTHGSGVKMHKAGYTVGKWRLVHLPSTSTEGEKDASSATIVQCTSLEDPRITDVADVKYSFKLICRLKSTSRGKMNKLEMLQLLARNHRTGEAEPIPVKQANGTMPSFYFSRVLSYD